MAERTVSPEELQTVRTLVSSARQAMEQIACFSQEAVDRLCRAVAWETSNLDAATRLARTDDFGDAGTRGVLSVDDRHLVPGRAQEPCGRRADHARAENDNPHWYSSIGTQAQKRFRSPQTLSMRATLGQNLCSRSQGAG